MIVRRYLVRGKVQGVGFRWFVRQTARTLGMSGSVRNEPSGEVWVEAAGDVAVHERLEAALWRGPVGARVDAVISTIDDSEPGEPLPTPFCIVR